MILIDTGSLIALLDRNDPNHLRCVVAVQNLTPGPLLTTLPCFTDAIYFAGKEGGYQAQQRLWAIRTNRRLIIHPWSAAELDRMETLMAQYADAPMDLADASLVATAESLGISQILTLDRHFYAYLISGNTPFNILV